MKSFYLAWTDLKKFIKSPKAIMLLVFVFFFTYDFTLNIRPIAEAEGLGVTPFVYAIFMNEWNNVMYVMLLICLLLSDAPFKNGSEMIISLKAGKYKWYFGKVIYIAVLSAGFQLVLAVMSFAVFGNDTGISGDWGYVLRSYLSEISGSIGYDGEVSVSVLEYVPIKALGFQIILATLVSIMLGMMIFILNTLFKSYIGTIAVSVISCGHLLLNIFKSYNQISFDLNKLPTSWITISAFTKSFTPGMAMLILTGIILLLTAVGLMLVKIKKINVYD